MEKRFFPWRKNPTPYRVWVSEVMLQQTRASVVVPYFAKWMERFPTIEALAEAKIEEVIKLWEGLGYYSRARALHEGAQTLIKNYNGKFPTAKEELKNIKGLGPYTIGAILSFAFHQKEPAVDGNVKRVISRLHCIEEPIDSTKTQKQITEHVEGLLPEKEPWIVMEALIELGASLCGRNPKCLLCPLKEDCLAFHRGKAEDLPKKSKRTKVIDLERIVSVIRHRDLYLVQKHKKGRVMADLYEFPYHEKKGGTPPYPAPVELEKPLQEVKHGFTRYRARLYPSLFRAEEKIDVDGFEWIPQKELGKKPFSSGHKKILKQILEVHAHTTH